LWLDAFFAKHQRRVLERLCRICQDSMAPLHPGSVITCPRCGGSMHPHCYIPRQCPGCMEANKREMRRIYGI
jgi:hypothetical protein